MGGTLKEGEKGHPVFYWEWPEKSGMHTNKKEKLWLRYFLVYNISQCNGITKARTRKIRKPRFPLEMCFSIFRNMPNPPAISHGALPAVFMPTLDCIEIPRRDHYPNDEMYYATLFRCLIHSTGHESRLNRKEVMEATVTDHKYHITEALIGDIGASLLCSIAGIRYEIRKDTTNYCKDWIGWLKKDPRIIVYVSEHANRAVDYTLRRNPESSPL